MEANNRIATALRSASVRMTLAQGRLRALAADQRPAEPGDVYVIPKVAGDVGVEWLVVRAHLDDPDTLLLVPTDDAELFQGEYDVPDRAADGTPMVARCGYSVWCHRRLLTRDNRVDAGRLFWARSCRGVVAALARGNRPPGLLVTAVPAADPEHEEHEDRVAVAVASLDQLQ